MHVPVTTADTTGETLENVLRKLAQDGRIPATFEVVYGHAWKGEPKRTQDGLPIVKVERRNRG